MAKESYPIGPSPIIYVVLGGYRMLSYDSQLRDLKRN